jgi:hypothetical protein
MGGVAGGEGRFGASKGCSKASSASNCRTACRAPADGASATGLQT